MPRYRVLIHETQGGTVEIDADSPEDADKIAEEGLDEHGIDGFKDFKCTHREYDVLEVIL